MKWQTLRHNGVAFPPAYDYRGLTIRIKNEMVKLTPEQEEMLMAWAKKKDTPYVLDPVFQKNFLGDLKTKLEARFADITLDDIDFTELHAIVEREKTANLSKEERQQRSAQRQREREELKARYGIAIIDGKATEVGAYLVEPPGILMGRGNHPLRGRWKERVQPEDVTLNLDEDAPVPPAPPGHHWKEIVHEHDAMWLASWYDKLSAKRKYIWLADSADLRQARDQEKYIQAVELEKHIDKVRAEIAQRMTFEDKRARAELDTARQELHAKRQALETRLLQASQAGDPQARQKLENALDRLRLAEEKLAKRQAKLQTEEMKTRQLATVCYLIDRLAMRVGDEKEEDEADTVGASTLRVEHVRVGTDRIEFDFLGKDSVQWQKSLPLESEGERVLARNLQDLARGKQPGDQLFDKIDSTHVNRFLGSIVEGLTAKVFRTYHATQAVRTALLRDGNLPPETPTYRKEYVAKLANLEAAIVCNHKRTPPKTWQESLAKREQHVARLRAAQPDLNKLQAQVVAREKALEKLRAAQPALEKLQARVQQCEEALAQARAAQAALSAFEEQVNAKQAALAQAIAAQQKIEAAAQAALKKKQAALDTLTAQKPPQAKKALANYRQRWRAARQAIAATRKAHEEKIKRAKARVLRARRALDATVQAQRAKTRLAAKRIAQLEAALQRAQEALLREPQRYAERSAKARQALEKARRAIELAQQNYHERVERATLQLDLAKRTRDYNLGTSLKNYIDPSVYKLWGDYVGFDWKRLYTKALQRKFAWVERVRGTWKKYLEG